MIMDSNKCIRSKILITIFKALAKLNNTTNLPIKNSTAEHVSPEQVDCVDGDSPVRELINKHLGKRHHRV